MDPDSRGTGTKPADFLLTSQQCLLLVAFESGRSLSDLARLIGRDVSVVSRQLKQLATQAPVLEKENGMWKLTALGRKLNQWTRSAIAAQRGLLQQKNLLRIACSREFAARVLAPRLFSFIGGRGSAELSLLTSSSGIESFLLEGTADFGFDFGRPRDPVIRYKKILSVPLFVVAAPEFVKRHGIRGVPDLAGLPRLEYQRPGTGLPPLASAFTQDPLAVFNDISTTREVCIAGSGWTVLPQYAVEAELEDGRLLKIPSPVLPTDELGVWWVRGNAGAHQWIGRAIQWLTWSQAKWSNRPKTEGEDTNIFGGKNDSDE